MKKYSALFLSGLVLALFVLTISSCKDDDEPVTYKLGFTESTMTVNEADGTLEVELKLDKPAPKDIEIEYSLDGTAFDDVRAAAEDEYSDYYIDGSYGTVEIEEGETTGIITIELYSDDSLEEDETIEITINDVDESNIDFSDGDETIITVIQEDGMLIALTWPTAGTAGVADMDILLRVAKTAPSLDWDGILTGSVYRGFNSNLEVVFVPNTFIGTTLGLDYTDTSYGLTYTYYGGTLNPLDFKATFIEFIDGDFEDDGDEEVFTQTYTLDNINEWENTALGIPTIIAQTFRNNNGVFSDISAISVQAESSRIISNLSNINKMLNPAQSKRSTIKTLDFEKLPKKLRNKLNVN